MHNRIAIGAYIVVVMGQEICHHILVSHEKILHLVSQHLFTWRMWPYPERLEGVARHVKLATLNIAEELPKDRVGHNKSSEDFTLEGLSKDGATGDSNARIPISGDKRLECVRANLGQVADGRLLAADRVAEENVEDGCGVFAGLHTA